jgi:D-amino-acid oxidase
MTSSSKKIAIVGQGVMGLTCAKRLLQQGFSVDIYSKEEFLETTSMAAGAFWWPHKAYPEERISKWAKSTYDEYKQTRSEPGSGVHFERHYRFCIDPDDCAYARFLIDDCEEIDGSKYGFPCHEAYLMNLPVIDVPIFMPYLREQIISLGASVHIKEIESPAELFPNYDLVVNCTGVWAHHFVNDQDVFPIRGQVVRLSLPEGLKASTRLFQKNDRYILILPRTDDVVLGGTAQEGNWDRKPSDTDSEFILKQCIELVPELADSQILGTNVGLRPGRKEVRLELEQSDPNQPVIHNYGHGGSGYTVAWGCADEVAELAVSYFSQ